MERKRDLTADIYKDKGGKWRWRITAGNGRILAVSSQGYINKQDCVDCLNLVLAVDIYNEEQ